MHWALALLFQILTVVSRETDAIKVPSGLTATSVTAPVWPANLFGRAFGRSPHAKMSPSCELEITYFRDGRNMHLVTLSL